MNAKDVIRQVIEFSDMVIRAYVADLGAADMVVRVQPGANHIAWQLGHIILGSQHMIAALGHPVPPLPPQFAEKYTKETAVIDDPAKFASKDECLGLLDQMKAAALAAVAATPDAALDQPGPEAMRDYAPTVASILTLLGTHQLMHAGQFVPIRRKLGKPPLF